LALVAVESSRQNKELNLIITEMREHTLNDISGSHGVEYEDDSLQGY
jgi:hypothetical protein